MATMEKLEGSKVKLTVEVPADKFEEAVQKAFRVGGKKYRVHGFRPGKAPRRVIENAYGPMAFFDDAFDIVYPDAYEAAVNEHGIDVLDRPDVSIVDFPLDGKPLVFTAEVPVRPEVKLGQYKGIEIEKHEYNVTDDEVAAAIEEEREKIARMVVVERPAEKGDTLNLDYEGSVDGRKFDGGAAEGASLEIGSHSFIEGFEEQLIGMAAGEEKDITVTFPEKYHAEELAGREAVFHVKVNGVQVKELPELDDEFAKDVSECNTLEELRAEKRGRLEELADRNAKTAKENAVVAKVVDNAEVEIPEVLIERQIDSIINGFRSNLGMQGISMEDYLKYAGVTAEKFRSDCRPEAVNRAKSLLVLDAVRRAEGVKATDEEIEAKIAEFAKRYGDKAEEFKKDLNDGDREYFADKATSDKVLAIMVDSAVETEPAETGEAAGEKTEA